MNRTPVPVSPRNISVSVTPPGDVPEGVSVSLTCSSDANPPVENYTWFKVNESTQFDSAAVGSEQQFTISNIRPEDAGEYYCEARNKLGSDSSSVVSLSVTVKTGAIATVAIYVCVAAVVVIVGIVLGLCLLSASKRKRGAAESKSHAAVAKPTDHQSVGNNYSSVKLTVNSSDYENVMVSSLTPTPDTYMALEFKSQSDYETLTVRDRGTNDTDNVTDQPSTDIYETLGDVAASGQQVDGVYDITD
ncbi:B-cell receptor CD22-like [Engraulis encrasicolus]|uniref:B-cell receptor CD22-like n=1 Tax=Engraulis encrasicolus TaxID=184585 RepID=UPI002FCEC16B